jgi:hypothetical protein
MKDDGEEDEGPVFDRPGRVVRIRRRARRYQAGGIYFIVWPGVLLFSMFIIGFVFVGSAAIPLIFAFFLLLYGAAALLYISKAKRPAGSIDLTRDSISQFCGSELDTEIRFNSTVDVDIVLDEYAKDPEYGHLYGFRFSRGEDVIEFTAGDGWELWDIQGISRPVFEVVDIHGMRQSVVMRDYREALAGGVPRRHRRH